MKRQFGVASTWSIGVPISAGMLVGQVPTAAFFVASAAVAAGAQLAAARAEPVEVVDRRVEVAGDQHVPLRAARGGPGEVVPPARPGPAGTGAVVCTATMRGAF